MTNNKNWPQLSASRIDQMTDHALSFTQEKPQVIVFWSRPALALAASIVLLIAVAVSWQMPRYSAPHVENVAATEGGDLSDYMMYELLEDLT